MRKYLIIGAILANSSALSQEVKPFTLVVTPQELGVIAQALGDRPYREAAPLLQKLEAQIREQQAAAAAKPAEPAK